MKPITFPRLSLVFAMAATLSGAAADTITLKSGAILKGNITAETTDSYQMEVIEGPGIKDSKKVLKADVAKVEKLSAADKEATALLDELKTIPDGLSLPDYDKRIKKLQAWVDKYKADRTAKTKPDVEALLKLHTEEQAKVKAGDIKLRGQWVTAEEAKWNEYNINARKLRVQMDALFKANKPFEAYQTASRIEASYVASIDFPPVVDVMKKKLSSVEAAISKAITDYPITDANRKQLLAQLTPEKKKEMDETLRKERVEAMAKITQDKKDKISIPGFYVYDLKTIQDSLAALKKEEARLAAIDVSGMSAANKKFEQGLKDMNSKSFLSAKNNFEVAAKFHTKDVGVKKKLEEATKAANDAKAKPVKPPVK
jgi:hypothetical protein